MSLLRHFLRFQSALHLMLALETGEETLVGGQAVLEGVMMRSPHAWGIAVRRMPKNEGETGAIVTHSEPLDRPSEKHKWMGWPVLRGLATLGQAMSLGIKSLRFSSNIALEDVPVNEEGKTIQISGWVMTVNMIFSLAFFIVMYKFIPLVLATQMKRVAPVFGNYAVFNLVDGAIRIGIFVAFIWALSRWKDIHRVFEYHGAEHKTVFTFEAHEPLDVPVVQKHSTFHPRCGTSFLITVMMFSILIYAAVPVTTFWARFAVRLALLPLVVGLSYEIIRYAAKHRSGLFAIMTIPGLWLQRITTQPPDDQQTECAIVALNEAMELEKQRGGELVIA